MKPQDLSIPAAASRWLQVPQLRGVKREFLFVNDNVGEVQKWAGLAQLEKPSWDLTVALSGLESPAGEIVNCLLPTPSRKNETQCLAPEDPQDLRR